MNIFTVEKKKQRKRGREWYFLVIHDLKISLQKFKLVENSFTQIIPLLRTKSKVVQKGSDEIVEN